MSKDLTAALAALSRGAGQTTQETKTLRQPQQAPPIPARSGKGVPVKKTGTGSIASPLTETAFANRTFHAEQALTSTDGIFTLKIKPLKTVTFTDANGATVSIEYMAPT